MKCIRKTISALLVLSMLAVPLTANATAKNVDGVLASESIAPITELSFEYDYDTTQVFRYDCTTIPVDFHIKGLRKEQTCTVSVSSSLEISNSIQRSSNIFGSENNHVKFNLSFTPKNTTQRVGSVNDLSIDHIVITANSDLDGTIPCTLTMYVLNSPYGTFVSYIGEEEVKDYYYQWMYENSIIDESEYEAIVDTKGLTEIIDEQTYLTAINSTGKERGVQETSVYVNYKITANGKNLTVSGALTWTDSNGASHPLKQAKVEIVDEDASFNEVVGTTYTSSNGTFSVTFVNQTGAEEDGGCDIFIKAYPASSNIAVKNTSNVNYSLHTPTTSNVTGNVDTFHGVLNPCNAANAFQIHQAGIVGAQYVKSLSGTAPALLNFRYPYSDSGSNSYNRSYVKIKSSSYYSWDIILHEYGHYIQDVYNIENNPGGTHNIGDNNIDVFVEKGDTLAKAKDKACRLSWAEGWATYFGLSAQQHQNVSSMGIPGAGDASYHNLYGGWNKDCESHTGCGEGNEMAVTCVLWDLADSPSWNGSKTEAHDSFALGYQTVWNYSVNSGATTFSDFMKYLYSMLSTTNYRNVGKILAAQNITAATPKTNNSTSSSYYFSSDSAPTFTWTATNGSTQCADNYALDIYDTSMNLIYSISIASGKTSHTLSNTRWENLKANYSGGFYWCVRVTPSSTPDTGPYYSQFIRCYLTNIL